MSSELSLGVLRSVPGFPLGEGGFPWGVVGCGGAERVAVEWRRGGTHGGRSRRGGAGDGGAIVTT